MDIGNCVSDLCSTAAICKPLAEGRRADAGASQDTAARRIAPQTGVAFTLRKGQVLRVLDPMGEQVSDLFAFENGNLDRWLSSGRSIDYAGKTRLSTGDTLFSNDSRPMFTILSDTVGRHDFLLTPCSQEMFQILYGCKDHHPSCFENLATHLAPFGVKPAQIHTTFNIFMEVNVDAAGEVKVGVPRSKAGDWIEFRAEMDLICGLTACSAEGSNNGSFKPIDYIIREGTEPAGPAGPSPVERVQACNGGTTVVPMSAGERRQRSRVIKRRAGSGAWI